MLLHPQSPAAIGHFWLRPYSNLYVWFRGQPKLALSVIDEHTAPEATSGVTKNLHENCKRSDMEKKHTIILMYRSKRSLGKFLRYWIFFILTYHTLPVVPFLSCICSIEYLTLQNLKEYGLLYKIIKMTWNNCVPEDSPGTHCFWYYPLNHSNDFWE